MRQEYPALAVINEFKNLREDELRFCWYFACSASNIAKIENVAKRTREAILEAGIALDNPNAKQWILGEFTTEMRAAIQRMKSFHVSYRLRAKLLQEKAFERIENAVNNVTDEDLVDIQDKKDYVSLVKQTNETLPNLIEAIEGSGIKVTDKSKIKAKGGKTLMDTVMGR